VHVGLYTFAAVMLPIPAGWMAGCGWLAAAACWVAGCLAACWAATVTRQAHRYLISPCVYNNVGRWP